MAGLEHPALEPSLEAYPVEESDDDTWSGTLPGLHEHHHNLGQSGPVAQEVQHMAGSEIEVGTRVARGPLDTWETLELPCSVAGMRLEADWHSTSVHRQRWNMLRHADRPVPDVPLLNAMVSDLEC